MKLHTFEGSAIVRFFGLGLKDGTRGLDAIDWDAPNLQGPRPSVYARIAYTEGHSLGQLIREAPEPPAPGVNRGTDPGQ